MVIRRQTPHTGKDWSKELRLSKEIPVQGERATNLAIRHMLPATKVYGTTGQLTADDLDKFDGAVPSVAPLATVPRADQGGDRENFD